MFTNASAVQVIVYYPLLVPVSWWLSSKLFRRWWQCLLDGISVFLPHLFGWVSAGFVVMLNCGALMFHLLVLSGGTHARICCFGVVSPSWFVLGGCAFKSSSYQCHWTLCWGCFWQAMFSLPCAWLVFLIIDAAFSFCYISCFPCWISGSEKC